MDIWCKTLLIGLYFNKFLLMTMTTKTPKKKKILCCPSWSSMHRISWEFPTEQASNPITASKWNKTICLDFLHLCRQELSEERVNREGNCADERKRWSWTDFQYPQLNSDLKTECILLVRIQNHIVARTHKDANLYLISWDLPEYLQSDKHFTQRDPTFPPNFSVQ